MPALNFIMNHKVIHSITSLLVLSFTLTTIAGEQLTVSDGELRQVSSSVFAKAGRASTLEPDVVFEKLRLLKTAYTERQQFKKAQQMEEYISACQDGCNENYLAKMDYVIRDHTIQNELNIVGYLDHCKFQLVDKCNFAGELSEALKKIDKGQANDLILLANKYTHAPIVDHIPGTRGGSEPMSKLVAGVTLFLEEKGLVGPKSKEIKDKAKVSAIFEERVLKPCQEIYGDKLKQVVRLYVGLKPRVKDNFAYDVLESERTCRQILDSSAKFVDPLFWYLDDKYSLSRKFKTKLDNAKRSVNVNANYIVPKFIMDAMDANYMRDH